MEGVVGAAVGEVRAVGAVHAGSAVSAIETSHQCRNAYIDKVLQGSICAVCRCGRYYFTDVSEVFLHAARARFANYEFVDYLLCNINMDPCLQGFARHACHALAAANVLHATPVICNTLRHCKQLLREDGFFIATEEVATFGRTVSSATRFHSTTFALTDGWWLFGESGDCERVGQDSPLMSWRQWQALLDDSGFRSTFVLQGEDFLLDQAVIVGKMARNRGAYATDGLVGEAHLLSGGLGGLGLLHARVLADRGARQLVLSSRSTRVAPGSEVEWEWLTCCCGNVRRVSCNASENEDVRSTIRALSGDGIFISSIFHAAHQLADALLASQCGENFRLAFAPKVGDE